MSRAIGSDAAAQNKTALHAGGIKRCLRA